MKLIICYPLFCFLVITIKGASQETNILSEIPIGLTGNLSETYNEFSGVAKWGTKILLIPQHPDSIGNIIYVLDSNEIDNYLVDPYHEKKVSFSTLKIRNLTEIQDKIKAKLKFKERWEYGGFEAAVVVKNSIYFTVETNTVCFIVKGTLEHNAVILRDTMSITKPDTLFKNAGYESLAYLENENKLIAVYENNLLNRSTAYIFDTSLNHLEPVKFESPLFFRLTDIHAFTNHANQYDLIGINHLYNDFRHDTINPTEFNYYTTGNLEKVYSSSTLLKAQKEMHSYNLFTSSFTRLVGMTVRNKEINWREIGIISYSEDNWEGILPFKQGVLMVVDGIPPNVPCKLSYFKL